MSAYDRFEIDGITPPMSRRPRPFDWALMAITTAGWTLGTAALVWLLLRIGGA